MAEGVRSGSFVNRSPTVSDGGITLRLIRQRDAPAWREVRRRNRDWLQPWEATLPPEASLITEVPATFGEMVRRMRKDARAGRALPWAIIVDGQFAGQLTVGGITYGSLRSAYIGYWIDKELAGRGIMPTAVAMACDYCLDVMRLHRIEINIRPENTASLRVVEKIGIRKEGERPKFLHIDGEWRDHVTHVVVSGEFPEGVLDHLRARHAER
jgi:ribosomal-protein-alanine N-acetyltransferase